MAGTQQELEQLSKQLRQQAFEMKKAFSVLERTKWIRPTVDELLDQGHKWESWYAWRPIKDTHNKWHWLTKVYRIKGNTYVDYDSWTWYHYGTLFDVIARPE